MEKKQNKGFSVSTLSSFFSKWKSVHLPLFVSLLLLLFCSAFSFLLSATEIFSDIPNFVRIPFYGISFLSILLFIQSLRFRQKKQTLRTFLDHLFSKTAFTQALRTNYSYRTGFFAGISLLFNGILAISKIYAGWFYSSIWLMILSSYYIVLTLSKTFLVSSSKKKQKLTDQKQILLHEWKTYRRCGKMILILTVTLESMVVMMVRHPQTVKYDQTIVLAMAAYDFYCVISGFVFIFSQQKKYSPITNAIKSVSLASSLVSILSLQTAMFGLHAADGQENFQTLMSALTGSGICLFLLIFGCRMIYHSTKQMEQINQK